MSRSGFFLVGVILLIFGVPTLVFADQIAKFFRLFPPWARGIGSDTRIGNRFVGAAVAVVGFGLIIWGVVAFKP